MDSVRRVEEITVALLLILIVPVCVGSPGDRDKRYTTCLGQCATKNCSDVTSTTYKQSQSSYMQLLLWNCTENCKYECMRANYQLRKTNQEPIVQYYGKWPFLRVFGIQEIASTVFSIGNFIPHAQYISYVRQEANDSVMKNYYTLYSIAAYVNSLSKVTITRLNAWLWSAVFHTRDFRITEYLDYFSADFYVLAGLLMTTIRVFDIQSFRTRSILTAAITLFFSYHVYYMAFIKFDYGYNTLVGICAGTLVTFLWLFWLIRNWNSEVRTYGWKIMGVQLSMWAAASLEILDFAPLYDLLDAHSMWHAATIPITYLWYSFILHDLRFHLKKIA